MFCYTAEDIRVFERNMIAGKRTFRVEEKRGNLYIYEDGKIRRFGLKLRANGKIDSDIPNAFLFSFVGGVRSEIDAFLDRNNGVIDSLGLPVNGININKDWFAAAPVGTLFWEADIDHCYFQILHNFGYISSKFYNKYCNLGEYKQGYIYSVSWLDAKKEVRHYDKGVLIKTDIVASDSYCNVFKNVRGESSRLISDAVVCLGAENVFRTTIDSIMYSYDYKEFITNHFESIGYKIKNNLCKKDTANSYVKGGKQTIVNKYLVV